VRRTVPPSAEIEAQIDRLLSVGVGENPRESLSELARLGATLIIQRAVEDEFDAWLGRARYERRPDHQRGLRNYDSGLRNGCRPRRVQTLEGEVEVEIPQVREAAEPFVSKLFPCSTKVLRTEPLRAMVIGAFVRGLSMRDIESLCEKAGLGKLSREATRRAERGRRTARCPTFTRQPRVKAELARAYAVGCREEYGRARREWPTAWAVAAKSRSGRRGPRRSAGTRDLLGPAVSGGGHERSRVLGERRHRAREQHIDFFGGQR
jgi:hypothetical protein